jgi:hypothetical protein
MSRKFLEYSLSLFLIVSSVSIIAAVVGAKSTLDYYIKYAEAQRQAQKEMLRSANKVKEIAFEAGIILIVRVLEKQEIIPPTEADKLVIGSLEIIEKDSERLGKIAKFINDQMETVEKVYFAKREIPSLNQKDDPGVSRLSFKKVSGAYLKSRTAGQLFVIKGLVTNNYPSSRSYILLKGTILDNSGEVVTTKLAYAGNTFREDQIKMMSSDELNQAMKNRSGRKGMNEDIKPGKAIPFVIIFENLPYDVGEFTVEAVRSSP